MLQFVVFGALLFMIAIALSARLNRASFARLSDVERGRYVDAARATPSFGFNGMLIILAAWIVAIVLEPRWAVRGSALAIGAMLVLSIVAWSAMYLRLRRFGLPAAFLKEFAVIRTLRLMGAIALFGAVGTWLLRV